MALERLTSDQAYRWRIAHRLAFADWENPTVAELNANSDNSDPNALIINPTCALSQDGSQFDLDDPELDETLSFCQSAGSGEVLTRSATVVFEYFDSAARWLDATSTAAVDGYNSATLTHSWLAWRGLSDVFAILSVGPDQDAPFAVGDRIKMAEFATDYAIPNVATGTPRTWTQTTASRSDINWNYELAS